MKRPNVILNYTVDIFQSADSSVEKFQVNIFNFEFEKAVKLGTYYVNIRDFAIATV